MGLMKDSVHNGIRNSGVSDEFMPVLDGKLAGNNGGPGHVPVFNDFKEIFSIGIGERVKAEVINDQNPGFREFSKMLKVIALAPGSQDIAKKPGPA